MDEFCKYCGDRLEYTGDYCDIGCEVSAQLAVANKRIKDLEKIASDATHHATREEQARRAAVKTLRDDFAGQALQGLFANQSIVDGKGAAAWIATYAYEAADAMLAERNRERIA